MNTHRHPAISPLALQASGYLSRREYRQNVRLGAVYRLLRKRKIGRQRAVEILAAAYSSKEMKTINAGIEQWNTNEHFRGDMLP